MIEPTIGEQLSARMIERYDLSDLNRQCPLVDGTHFFVVPMNNDHIFTPWILPLEFEENSITDHFVGCAIGTFSVQDHGTNRIQGLRCSVSGELYELTRAQEIFLESQETKTIWIHKDCQTES